MKYFKINLKIHKKKRLKGFTFVEVLAAIAISVITLLAMTKISLQMTQLALQNDASDKATQIASRTTESLLRLRDGQNSASSGNLKFNIPGIYSACGDTTGPASATYPPSQYISTSYDQTLYLPVYLNNNSNTIDLFKAGDSNYGTIYSGSPNLKSFSKTDMKNKANVITNSTNIEFVRDNLLDQNDIFYRSVGIQYNPTYKIVIAQVIITWSLYGKDNFYVSYPTFSLSSVCK